MSCDIYFVSAEPSGDDLTVSVIRQLQALQPELSFGGIGGKTLEKVGITSPVDVSPLSVVDFFAAIFMYPTVVRLADQTTAEIISSGAKIAVLVDAWGFCHRVAQRLREQAPHIKVIKLVGPQVWATRPGRAKTLASIVDHLLCIHEFELPFYEPFDLPCTVIGNPALGNLERGDGEKFRAANGILPDQKLVLVLPGSRSSEISRVAPVLAEAAIELVGDNMNDRRNAVLVAPSVQHRVMSDELKWPKGTIFVTSEDQKNDVMAAADLGLACSGTVTSELATQGCPMIVGYKLGFLSWALAKVFLLKTRFITLFNVAAGKEVAKELVQFDLTTANVVDEANRLLADERCRLAQIEEQYDALRSMGWGKPPAAKIAADVIRSYL